MLDKLDVELKVDREETVALLAEYSGLLEIVVEDISRIREIDESRSVRPFHTLFILEIVPCPRFRTWLVVESQDSFRARSFISKKYAETGAVPTHMPTVYTFPTVCDE